MNHVLNYGDYFNVMRNGSLVESGSINKLTENEITHTYTKQLLKYKNTLRKDGNL